MYQSVQMTYQLILMIDLSNTFEEVYLLLYNICSSSFFSYNPNHLEKKERAIISTPRNQNAGRRERKCFGKIEAERWELQTKGSCSVRTETFTVMLTLQEHLRPCDISFVFRLQS